MQPLNTHPKGVELESHEVLTSISFLSVVDDYMISNESAYSLLFVSGS